MRRADDIGQLEIRIDSVYKGEDVYIVAQQATQVYYLPWACQKDEELKSWYLVHLLSPRGKAPVPNEYDYNFDPMVDTGEFYLPEGLQGCLVIDLDSTMGMEVDNDIDEDEGEVVQDAKDLMMLERRRAKRDRLVSDDDNTDSDTNYEEDLRDLDNIDTDDDNSDTDDELSTFTVGGDNF